MQPGLRSLDYGSHSWPKWNPRDVYGCKRAKADKTEKTSSGTVGSFARKGKRTDLLVRDSGNFSSCLGGFLHSGNLEWYSRNTLKGWGLGM